MAYPTLNINELVPQLNNMIISINVYGDPFAGSNDKLLNMFKVDGGRFGDTKLFTDTDVLFTTPWAGGDGRSINEEMNLLEATEPPAPNVQAIVLNKFRKIMLTTGPDVLLERAFMDEGQFGAYMSAQLAWIERTKTLYMTRLVNTFVGHEVSEVGKQLQEIDAATATDAKELARYIADLVVDLGFESRDYTDNGFMKSFAPENLVAIWNPKYYNKIKYVDLPVIFHDDSLLDAYHKLETILLQPQFFGDVNKSGGSTPATNTKIRALVEKDYGAKHCFPGDLLPNSTSYLANETYTESEDYICKITTRDAIPVMSSFAISTEFWNSRSLRTNHYNIWSYNDLVRLVAKPFITLKKGS